MVLSGTSEHVYLLSRKGVLALEETPEGLKPVGVTTTEAVTKAFQKGFRSPRLTKNCVGTGFANRPSGAVEYFIYELPGGSYTLPFDDENYTKPFKQLLDVSLPWMYMILFITNYKGTPVMERGYLCAAKNQLKSFDEPIYQMPTPNVSQGDCGICWGHNPLPASKGEDPCEFGERLLKHFFDSKFNRHLWPRHDGLYTDWTDWAKKTKVDPNFMEKANLFKPTYRNSINSILDSCGV